MLFLLKYKFKSERSAAILKWGRVDHLVTLIIEQCHDKKMSFKVRVLASNMNLNNYGTWFSGKAI